MEENTEEETQQETQPKVPQQPPASKKRQKVEVSPFVLMGEIMEFLRFLGFEKKFQPLPPYYFAFEFTRNPSEQFRRAIELFVWILKELVKLRDFEQPNLYDDPNTTATNILLALKKAGLKMEVQPSSIVRAHGTSLCLIIHKLLSYCCKKRGYSIRNAIIYDEEYLYKDLDELSIDIDDVEEEETLGDYISEDEEMDGEYYEGGGKNTSQNPNFEELLAFEKQRMNKEFPEDHDSEDDEDRVIEDEDEDEKVKVPIEDWLFELEQITPHLVVQLHEVDVKNWRSHVETMKKQESQIHETYVDLQKILGKISENIGKAVERIQKREKMINNDHDIMVQLKNMRKVEREAREVQEQFKKREEATIKLSDEVNSIVEEINEVKKKLKEKEDTLSDNSKVNKIRETIHRLSKEIRQMDLRAGVLQHQVTKMKMNKRRAASAQSNKYVEI